MIRFAVLPNRSRSFLGSLREIASDCLLSWRIPASDQAQRRDRQKNAATQSVAGLDAISGVIAQATTAL